ncbi:MAG: LysR family transcriptional regulator, partial [Pseudomonadota bacterium]
MPLRATRYTMSITLKQLETFVAVADLGGFGRAAERLSTTQPNVSSRIAALEDALGGSVLVRDSGTARLTALGERTLARAREVLDARDALIDTAARPQLHAGSLRIGVTEVIAATWLGDLLDALRAELPNVLVELTVGLSVELTDALVRREVLWSKFAHMFFKPAAAFQKRVAVADGSLDNLPKPAD